MTLTHAFIVVFRCDQGENALALPRHKLVAVSHLMNALGVATESIGRTMERRQATDGSFHFERFRAQRRPNAPPPVQQPVPVQPTTDELEHIRRHICICKGRGGYPFSIRNRRNGTPIKFGHTHEELFLWVYDNLPNWRDVAKLN